MEGYRARLTDPVVRGPGRRPASIASAVGRGLGALADAGNAIVQSNRQADQYIAASDARIAEDAKRRNVARLSADFAGKYAEAGAEVERRLAEARKATGPGAPGWDQTVSEIQGEVYGGLLDQYGPQAQDVDEELALHFGGMVRSATAQTLGREIDWQAKTAQKHEGDSLTALVDTEANGLIGIGGDKLPEALKSAMLRVGSTIDNSDYDGTAKAYLRRVAFTKLVTGGAFRALEAAGDYARLKALAGSGEFDALLGDDKASWIKTADGGLAMQQRQAEAAQADALAAAMESLAQVKVRIANGDVPPLADIQGAMAAAKAAGAKDSDLLEYAYLAEKGLDAREFGAASTATLAAEATRLQSLRDAGGLDARGARRLETLDGALDARATAKGEAISTLWKSGPQAQAQALAQVGGMAEADAWRAAVKAGQPKLFYHGKLPASSHALAIEGAAVRSAKGGAERWLPAKKGKDGGADAAALNAAFAARLGAPLADQLRRAGAFDALREAALDYYVGNRARKGIEGWNPAAFGMAVQVASGARYRPDGKITGGIGTVRGKVIELPDNMTAAEFDSAFTQGDFSGARYRGGAVASKPDILAHYRPVPVSDTSGAIVRYRFLDARGAMLVDAKGAPYEGLFRQQGGR